MVLCHLSLWQSGSLILMPANLLTALSTLAKVLDGHAGIKRFPLKETHLFKKLTLLLRCSEQYFDLGHP